MRVVITNPARESLREIYDYYKKKGLGKHGRILRSNIIQKSLILKNFPNAGQEEEHLKKLN